ncbi:MAG TPA: hypothetical protein VM238_04520 [Phycisphaerae bacterium]|nr:hypothetical protein [Phycisphaerae bacterium]
MGDAAMSETVGDMMFLVGTALVGCLIVLLALAGLLVYLLAKHQKQATFPMEMLLQQDLPGDERIRSTISSAIAAGRIPGFPSRSQPSAAPGTGPDADGGARLMTTSRGMAEAGSNVPFDETDPLGLG